MKRAMIVWWAVLLAFATLPSMEVSPICRCSVTNTEDFLWKRCTQTLSRM